MSITLRGFRHYAPQTLRQLDEFYCVPKKMIVTNENEIFCRLLLEKWKKKKWKSTQIFRRFLIAKSKPNTTSYNKTFAKWCSLKKYGESVRIASHVIRFRVQGYFVRRPFAAEWHSAVRAQSATESVTIYEVLFRSLRSISWPHFEFWICINYYYSIALKCTAKMLWMEVSALRLCKFPFDSLQRRTQAHYRSIKIF